MRRGRRTPRRTCRRWSARRRLLQDRRARQLVRPGHGEARTAATTRHRCRARAGAYMGLSAPPRRELRATSRRPRTIPALRASPVRGDLRCQRYGDDERRRTCRRLTGAARPVPLVAHARAPFGGFPREAAELAAYWRPPVRLDSRRSEDLIDPQPRTRLDEAMHEIPTAMKRLPTAREALSMARACCDPALCGALCGLPDVRGLDRSSRSSGAGRRDPG